MERILVDGNGYKQFIDELERLKELSLTSASVGNEAYKDAIGDGWHDNFAFEDSMRESRTIAKKIDKMLEEQSNLKIIETKEIGEELINIGDVFNIKIEYDIDDVEEEIVKLTGNYFPNINNNVKEITLNSPIGKAVFQKRINSKTSYFVRDKEIIIYILEKIQNVIYY